MASFPPPPWGFTPGTLPPPAPVVIIPPMFPKPDWRQEAQDALERDRQAREARAEKARQAIIAASLALEEAPGDGRPARRGWRRPWAAWARALRGAS